MSKNLINKNKTSKILKPTTTKPVYIYQLQKIHKKYKSGWKVISSINYLTSKLSKYVDHYLRLEKKIKPNIRDTTYLKEIKDI